MNYFLPAMKTAIFTLPSNIHTGDEMFSCITYLKLNFNYKYSKFYRLKKNISPPVSVFTETERVPLLTTAKHSSVGV